MRFLLALSILALASSSSSSSSSSSENYPKKWALFVSSPAGDKSADAVYGVGRATAGKLADVGIDKVMSHPMARPTDNVEVQFGN